MNDDLTADPAEPSSAAEQLDAGALALEALLALACVLLVAYLGAGVFATPSHAAVFTLGPLAGIVAALASRRWWIAAPMALVGVVVGTALAAAYSFAGQGRLALPVRYWLVAAVAAFVGMGVAALLARRTELARWVAWLGVAFVILAVCLCGSYRASHSTSVTPGFTPIGFLTGSPTVTADTYDEQIYVIAVRRMRASEGYYSAMGHTLAELNTARPAFAIDLSKPTSFRMPTLFWFLAALPADIHTWVIAMLVLVAAATVAAWSIAVRYMRPCVALVGTTVAGAYLSGFPGINLPLPELWAGALALVAVALALKSLSVRRAPLVWAAAAATVALLATLTRELAVAFLLVGLASTLVAERVRSRRLWIPWALALGFAAIAYVAHAHAAAAIARALPRPTTPALSYLAYFDPTGRGVRSSLRLVTLYAWWAMPAAWVVCALGTIGGVIAPRDWPRRALLGGVTVGGAIALFCLHPPAVSATGVPGEWGHVVLPTIVACATLAFARIPGLARKRRS